MYFRRKQSQGRIYLQIVESHRTGDQVRQRVIATLGRLDELEASGQLDRLLRSGARFVQQSMVLDAARTGEVPAITVRRIGPALLFERLWAETGCQSVITALARRRGHRFGLERAVFLTVLHRLMRGGSDLAADRWREEYRIAGSEDLDLHHLYRAMAWLGEELPADQQDGATRFAPRCSKDLIEEHLFARRRDLFSRLDLVFMDTTSLYFEGLGGQSIGQYGYSKDHRPDLRQMILVVLIDGDGRPVCSEMWPGNTADVTSLVPVIDRLRRRFAIGRVCVVADRGMISAETIAALEQRGLLYILGVRERTDKLVRDVVLNDAAPFIPLIIEKRGRDTDYSAKAVTLGGVRYIVCINHQEAAKDAADRTAILTALERQLRRGDKALVGNTGFRRFLKTVGDGHFAIDHSKADEDARFDGVFVLRTNTDLNPLAAMLRYKQLWAVEQTFRTAKHLLATRPIFHKLDQTIRGHVFCSFLALVLKAELEARIAALGQNASWPAIIANIDALTETDVEQDGKRFLLRSTPRIAAGLALRAAGVALPPTVQAIAEH
ncbi:MAG TPA: IS1634 family transposase [Steroidobacteraceae bacterium]|nr:IS1634 family transposase [Steroidobacteraceae bacterium]